MMPGPDYFFVLKGLLNGEEGVEARRCGPPNADFLVDGWYFLFDDEWQDPDGTGPFDSRQEAEREAAKTLGV